MNVKVSDLMFTNVTALNKRHTVGDARAQLQRHNVRALPVLDVNGSALGVVTSTNLANDLSEDKPVTQVMSPIRVTIPPYADVSEAARTMRNHDTDHAVVTDENQIVGVISSFDLLELFDNHLYTMQNSPTPDK